MSDHGVEVADRLAARSIEFQCESSLQDERRSLAMSEHLCWRRRREVYPLAVAEICDEQTAAKQMVTQCFHASLDLCGTRRGHGRGYRADNGAGTPLDMFRVRRAHDA